MFMDPDQDSKEEPEVMKFLRTFQDIDPEIDLENVEMNGKEKKRISGNCYVAFTLLFSL